MLTLSDHKPNQTCAGLGRRDFLKAGVLGGLGLGSLTLPGLLEAKAKAVAQGKPMRNKSVVLLFLQGGPPHIEFFDPKMSAPAEYRSINGEIPRSRLNFSNKGTQKFFALPGPFTAGQTGRWYSARSQRTLGRKSKRVLANQACWSPPALISLFKVTRATLGEIMVWK